MAMHDESRLLWWGLVPVPRLSTAVGVVVVASVLGYFLFNRSTANLVAIVGAFFVTAVAFKHERGQDEPPSEL